MADEERGALTRRPPRARRSGWSAVLLRLDRRDHDLSLPGYRCCALPPGARPGGPELLVRPHGSRHSEARTHHLPSLAVPRRRELPRLGERNAHELPVRSPRGARWRPGWSSRSEDTLRWPWRPIARRAAT